MIERIVCAIDRSDNVTGVFMDPFKSFDSVHHVEFLSTRESRNHWYSTQLVWIIYFIYSRKQSVELAQVESFNQWTKVKPSLQTVTH